MIARTWHGAVPESKWKTYYKFLEGTGFKDYSETPGFIDLKVLIQRKDGVAHFLLVTFWESFEAIKGFAGEDYERAHYYPEDKDFLLEFEEFVQHYEVKNPKID